MNYSKQREQIYESLKQHVVHPTAEQIHDFLKEDGCNIGIATVYRNLNQMAANGMIKRIEALDDSVHYDHNVSEHHHFICEKCHRVFDVQVDVAPDVVTNTERSTGFVVTGYEIAFKGLCTECKTK